MLQHFRIGTKLTAFLILAFLLSIAISGFFLSSAMNTKAQAEIQMRAEMLTRVMNSVRSYTSLYVNPKLREQLQTSPEFIADNGARIFGTHRI